MNEKQKLTLSVDSSVVEKAKKLNLNISEITEQVLKGFTFEPARGDEEELLNKYKELFKIMVLPLKKFRVNVEVGHYILKWTARKTGETGEEFDTIYLSNDGSFYTNTFEDKSMFKIEHITPDFVEKQQITFYSPRILLSNFIDSLVKGAEYQKEMVKELGATKKIIEAISSSLFSQK